MIYLRSLAEFALDAIYHILRGPITLPDHAATCPDFLEPPAGTDIAMPDGTPIYDELMAREFTAVINNHLDDVIAQWSAEA